MGSRSRAMSEEDTRERPPSNPEPLFRPRSSKTPGMSKAKKRRRSDSALTPKEAFASSLDEEEEGGRPVPNSNSISALQGAVMACARGRGASCHSSRR
eukprot:scaffold117521_cov21-Tisochrysis_lutea.AAC.1